MKRILFIVLSAAFLFAANVPAASLTVEWDANTEPDLQSYNLYWGTESRVYGLPLPVGDVTQYTVDGLTEGETYYFAVTAVDTSGNESGYSRELEVTIPGGTPPPVGEYLMDDFEDGNYTGWEIVDEGTNQAPSDWSVQNGVLYQASNIFGGDSSGTEPYEPGTYALGGEMSWTDYTVDVQMRSGDDDGIGLMFRYQDEGSYYLFSMGSQRNYRSLVKRVNGDLTVLAEDSVAYEENRWYAVRVLVQGNRIQVYLDETLLFDVEDDSISGGRIGLYSWGNDESEFDDVAVNPIKEVFLADDFEDGNYTGWEIVDEGSNEGPSDWSVQNGIFIQASNIYGGDSNGTEPYEPGTYALNGESTWTDYTVDVQMRSGDDDGIGVMFRYRDADNYYLFSMGSQRNYRSLVKRVNGTLTVLAEDSVAYEENRWYTVGASIQANRILIYLDGNLLFDVEDESLSSGKIGLYSWGNSGSEFDDVEVSGAAVEPEPEIDETDPVIEIVTPTDTGTFETDQATVDLGGTASDNVGVSRVDWDNAQGTSGTAQGTAEWTATGIELVEGDNAITVIAADEAGNTDTASLTVTYISPDETSPQVSITSPTTAGTFETEEADIDISGTASDNNRVESITWVDSNGNAGEAAGTESWSISGLPLTEGENTLTVTAYDPAGNFAEDTIYIYYLEPITASLDDNFNDGDAEGWEIVDEGENEGPSEWYVVNGVFYQESNIYGGDVNGTDPYAAGTYALNGDSAWKDYEVKLTLRSQDDDGIGIMFRYQDSDNYYLFSMGRQREYRSLTKLVNGNLTVLAEDSVAYEENRWYSVSVQIQGSRIRVLLNAELLFDVEDDSISNGKIGLYSWGNRGSEFDDITVTPLEETVFSDGFEDGDYAGWEIVDEGDNQAPSDWSVRNGALYQASNIYGGDNAGTEPYEPGTYALGGESTWADYTVDVKMRSGDDDGIGIMFRYQDPDNYYLFSMGSQRSYRSLIKRVNGTLTVLAEDSVAYEENRLYSVSADLLGNRIRVYLDGALLFDVQDDSLSSGRIGLYSWGNQGSEFDDIRVR